MPLVITVANLKGGVGKTTTAVALAEAASYGGPVTLLDCDPQGSALDWARRAASAGQPLRSNVVGIAASDLHRRIGVATRGAAVAVIDAPPPGSLDIARAAIEAADQLVMPCPPNLADLARIPTTQAEANRGRIPARVVLTMVRAGLADRTSALAGLEGSGIGVFSTWLPLSVAVSRNYGQAVTGVLAAYGIALMGEILTIQEANSNG
jgi:chromosome partitioning protein